MQTDPRQAVCLDIILQHPMYIKLCHQVTLVENGAFKSFFHAERENSLGQKELYWYHKLKTYPPFGFNERDV